MCKCIYNDKKFKLSITYKIIQCYDKIYGHKIKLIKLILYLIHNWYLVFIVLFYFIIYSYYFPFLSSSMLTNTSRYIM